MNTIPYRDRAAAGRWLARELDALAGLPDVLVLGIPRGGVLVAGEVARLLRAPMDVFVVRKIRIGENPSRLVGAMASGGVCVLNQDVLQTNEAEALQIAEAIAQMREEVVASEVLFRESRPAHVVEGKNVVLIDDGAASGTSLRAAVAALRSQAAESITVALPVASAEAVEQVAADTEDLVCPFIPEPFYSIGLAYERFPRVSDDAARACMSAVAQGAYLNAPGAVPPHLQNRRLE